MKILLPWCLCRRPRGRCFLAAIKPAKKLDPGFLEHLRLTDAAVVLMTVVASILTAIYHMLKDGTMY
jgi:hypothetical protein